MPAGSPIAALKVVPSENVMFAAVVVSVPCPRSTIRLESLKFQTAISSAFTAPAAERQNTSVRDASESRRAYIPSLSCEKWLAAPRQLTKGASKGDGVES